MPHAQKNDSLESHRKRGSNLLSRLPLRPLLFAALLVAITSYVSSQPPAIPSNTPETTPSSGPGLAPGQASKVIGVAAQAAVRPYQVGAAGDMIGFSHSDGSGSQTITLIDTGKSWMAVYHIDRSGTIRLVSSRPIDADFSLQLNATSPLPDEIRQMTQGKK